MSCHCVPLWGMLEYKGSMTQPLSSQSLWPGEKHRWVRRWRQHNVAWALAEARVGGIEEEAGRQNQPGSNCGEACCGSCCEMQRHQGAQSMCVCVCVCVNPHSWILSGSKDTWAEPTENGWLHITKQLWTLHSRLWELRENVKAMMRP